MKYFVRVENFMSMQMSQDDFMGFFTSVRYFDSKDSEEKRKFIDNLANSSVISLGQYSWQHKNCYYGSFPVCIITEGVVGINCYREDKKTLIMYDATKMQFTEKELNSKETLYFYKM